MQSNRSTILEDGLRAALDGPEHMDDKTEFLIYQSLMRDTINRGQQFFEQSKQRVKDGTWGYIELYTYATFGKCTEDIDTFFDMLMDAEVSGNGQAIQVVLFSCLESCREWNTKASGYVGQRAFDLMMKCMEPEYRHIDFTQLMDFFHDGRGEVDGELLEYLWGHMEGEKPRRAFGLLFGLSHLREQWIQGSVMGRLESVTKEHEMSAIIDVLSHSSYLPAEWANFLSECLKRRINTEVLSECISHLRVGSDELRELIFERVIEINDRGDADDEEELGNLYSAAGRLMYGEILEHGLTYFPSGMVSHVQWRWVRATSYIVSKA